MRRSNICNIKAGKKNNIIVLNNSHLIRLDSLQQADLLLGYTDNRIKKFLNTYDAEGDTYGKILDLIPLRIPKNSDVSFTTDLRRNMFI